MTIGVAIIGSGIFARREHLPAVKACDALSLKAVYSRTRASAQTLVGDLAVDVYFGDSYPELLRRPDIDAVILALPIPHQAPFIEAALTAGKHVLSEKPMAPDVRSADQLLAFYNTQVDRRKVTWAVAENYRFRDAFVYARQEIEKLGRILGFHVQIFSHVQPGSPYYGGFLLDGGIHNVAALRLMLGRDAKPTSVAAFTTQLQPHLPPIDTVNAVVHCKSGISGTFALSFGTSVFGTQYTVACERGSVTVLYDRVVVREGNQKDGRETQREFAYTSGVSEEVAAWAASLQSTPNPLQSPEEALADLEMLEKMLTSNGVSQSLHFG